MKRLYFVSGIDTDAGKSYATGYLARKWRREGIDVVTQKFIQTGCPDGAVSEDVALHRRIMGMELLPEDLDHTTCPVRFACPASPDLAARLENRRIDFAAIERATERLLQLHQTVLLEGAGGLMAPLEGLYTTIDYIAERRLPLILVTNPRLGSVNHTLLSLEACRARGVEVEWLIYNMHPETLPEITADTRLTLQRYLALHHPRCLFMEVPYMQPGHCGGRG
ncbi:MAG: dethiobiotin synthase [Rikenellaceae bacterium]|jgi:dethiobiotin synthetase|nr:dethiobiotin synthase [Rikenellaceae bacterium]